MNQIFTKLVIYILTLFLILNVSCKSTGKTPETEVSEALGAEIEAEIEEVIEITEDIAAEDAVTEEIAESGLPAEAGTDEELSDLFVEELIAGIIEDFPSKQKPEPPVVTAVTTPPAAPAPTPAPIAQPAPATPPVRETPPSAPVVQVPVTPSEPELPAVLSAQLPAEEVAEEPAPPPARSNIPDHPTTRLDSPAQMGRTPLDTEIIYSRIVRATVGQTVEIPFRGNGWVYLGETASRRGIVYNSRRNESEGQSFIFSLEEAGVYSLRFYRQDFIRDFIINDLVQVIVSDAPKAEAGWFSPPADRGKVVAQPRWPSPLEEAQIRSGARLPSEPTVTAEPTPSASTRPSAAPRTSSQASTATTRPSSTTAQPPATAAQAPAATAQSSTAATQPAASRPSDASQSGSRTAEITSVTPPTTETQNTAQLPAREVLAPEILLERAEKSFEGGKVDEAISYLNYFLEDYPSGSDELYWLLGQYYEANSPSRNILLSLDYYKRLVNEYPQSRRLNDARRRIAYLERFYINIQ